MRNMALRQLWGQSKGMQAQLKGLRRLLVPLGSLGFTLGALGTLKVFMLKNSVTSVSHCLHGHGRHFQLENHTMTHGLSGVRSFSFDEAPQLVPE